MTSHAATLRVWSTGHQRRVRAINAHLPLHRAIVNCHIDIVDRHIDIVDRHIDIVTSTHRHRHIARPPGPPYNMLFASIVPRSPPFFLLRFGSV